MGCGSSTVAVEGPTAITEKNHAADPAKPAAQKAAAPAAPAPAASAGAAPAAGAERVPSERDNLAETGGALAGDGTTEYLDYNIMPSPRAFSDSHPDAEKPAAQEKASPPPTLPERALGLSGDIGDDGGDTTYLEYGLMPSPKAGSSVAGDEEPPTDPTDPSSDANPPTGDAASEPPAAALFPEAPPAPAEEAPPAEEVPAVAEEFPAEDDAPSAPPAEEPAVGEE
ncbi:hypothetical protein T484DRAFT_1902504, partial [Baffinella frigidus]